MQGVRTVAREISVPYVGIDRIRLMGIISTSGRFLPSVPQAWLILYNVPAGAGLFLHYLHLVKTAPVLPRKINPAILRIVRNAVQHIRIIEV